ncbi:hypothetical protein IMSHALPRED_000248 [Imshaugia aleurites]|uniref:Mitochondrial import inner membrane translocase subunit TIM50 n=1 Tax=Imshaugia aleurites TaxID=172621 RepID=A0A8H3I6F1_9LECA|nr:hypothetical protein IMSHALPRED_000248 [Imshaugia aleurites]
MDGTLGLENLSLEEPAAPRNASGANGGKCGRAEDKASLPSESGSTIPRVTGVPSVPRGSGFSVQKSALYSKANPQLTEATPVQYGRWNWTGSAAAKLGKAASKASRSSQATKAQDIDIVATPPASRKSPSLAFNNINTRHDNVNDIIHLPAPVPTSVYHSDARAIPTLLPSPQRLLLVLDLNGTLLYRPRASQNYTPRPGLSNFLKYAFANHTLLIWSSAQPKNVKSLCSRLFSRGQRQMLLGEWGRDTLGLTSAQYKERVQVYKRLDRIWANENLQRSHPDFEGGKRWGQHNTVLIDDSVLKASAQPFNHVEVPEFVQGGGEEVGDGRDVLGHVVEYLEEARKWSNVSGFLKQGPFKIEDWQKKAQGREQCGDDDQEGGVLL